MKAFLYSILLCLVVALCFSIRNDRQKKSEQISNSENPLYSSPSSTTNDNKSYNYKYVDPYITRNGKFVKGHGRKPVSTDPNAFKNRAKSRYYYETHKYIIKERRKNKSK
jgi:hypothetical protein